MCSSGYNWIVFLKAFTSNANLTQITPGEYFWANGVANLLVNSGQLLSTEIATGSLQKDTGIYFHFLSGEQFIIKVIKHILFFEKWDACVGWLANDCEC